MCGVVRDDLENYSKVSEKEKTDAVDYYNIDCLDPKTLQPQKMENLNLRKKHHSHKKRAEEKEENHENGDTESKSRERDSK